MTSNLEAQNLLITPDSRVAVSASYFAGYLLMVDELPASDAYQLGRLSRQLNLILGRSFKELEVRPVHIANEGRSTVKRVQDYITTHVDFVGREVALGNGIESADSIPNPFTDKEVVRAIWSYHQDKRHTVDTTLLQKYIPETSLS